MSQPSGQENIFRHSRFDVQALCRKASELREGQRCSCNRSQIPMSGSFNWAIYLSFDDGEQWVLRSPRLDGGIKSQEANSRLLASEAATLRYLKNHSRIPVPDIHSYK